MSRWRCNICKRIIDSRWGATCCGTFDGDDSWTELTIDESEILFLEQKVSDQKKAIDQLLERIGQLEKALENS